MATILYARVSTTDQTLEHQQTQAEKAGFTLDHVLADHGVSGVNTKLRDRPQGKRLFDMLRAGDTLVVRWLDRLGRNYEDVKDSINEFMKRGVIVRTIINDTIFDGATKDPIQKAVRDSLINFMAATAQAQAEATKVAQRAGIEAAKAKGDAYRGRRPSFTKEQLQAVHEMTAEGKGVSEMAKQLGISRQTIYRIKDDPVGAAKALAVWK